MLHGEPTVLAVLGVSNDIQQTVKLGLVVIQIGRALFSHFSCFGDGTNTVKSSRTLGKSGRTHKTRFDPLHASVSSCPRSLSIHQLFLSLTRPRQKREIRARNKANVSWWTLHFGPPWP